MRLFQTIAQIIIATSIVNCVPVPTLVDGPSDAGRRNSRALPDPDPNAVIPVNAKPKLTLDTPEIPQKSTEEHDPFIGFPPQTIEPGPDSADSAQMTPQGEQKKGEQKKGELMESVAYPLPPEQRPTDEEWSTKDWLDTSITDVDAWFAKYVPDASKKRKSPSESSESGSSAVGTTQQRPASGIPRPKRPKPNPDPDTPPSPPPGIRIRHLQPSSPQICHQIRRQEGHQSEFGSLSVERATGSAIAPQDLGKRCFLNSLTRSSDFDL